MRTSIQGSRDPAAASPTVDSRATAKRDAKSAASFHSAVRERTPRREEKDRRSSALGRAPEGMFVVLGLHPPIAGTGLAGRTVHSEVRTMRGTPATGVVPPDALERVRIGHGAGETRMHARISIGPHAGVELRAVERHGSVRVELVAVDAEAARALRTELPGLRAAVDAHTVHSVVVDVRAERDDSGRREPPPPDDESDGDGSEALSGSAKRSTPVTLDGELIF